jgi:hypothetical protein
MKLVRVDTLQKGDEFKVTESSAKTYTVHYNNTHGTDRDLVTVGVGGDTYLDCPRHCEVAAVTMWREVEVPCLAARHEGGLEKLFFNLADGGRPRGVICGECDDEITAEVSDMVKEPRRGDKVLAPGGRQLTITGFSEDEGTHLSDGSWLCASKLKPAGIRVWEYNPAAADGA